ncbi:unnamed protein product [Microthlaspi erraticum]|uniref:DUF1985 domain-containing protein n=1 Tax=Microthlaspi erraticum TaxID=1685480 RepID=A0A6D2KVK9_9BRAS|nr:unnamed protein product [Microthlaspi erraticum]
MEGIVRLTVSVDTLPPFGPFNSFRDRLLLVVVRLCSFANKYRMSSIAWFTGGEDNRLPVRLLKTDHFPNRRLNVYGKPDTIAFVKHTLRDCPEAFERIRNSRFGKLWDFPASRCPISCKLIHALLCRQLLSKKRYEMWTVFGGQPMRFSLAEFASVIGLHCGEYPEGYDPDWYPPTTKGPDKWWKKFIGNDSRRTLGDISKSLRNGEVEDSEQKLRLCLILLVDGVLCVSSQVHRPTPKYVAMLEDIDAFLEFPWGRESFIKTIATMGPLVGKEEDPVGTLVKNLGQESFRLLGFPLALQVWAFQAIHVLSRYLPASATDDTLLSLEGEEFPQHPSLSYVDVINAENHPDVRTSSFPLYFDILFGVTLTNAVVVRSLFQLSVTPFIALEPEPGYIGWGEFAEQEVQDRKVAYLHELLSREHKFCKSEWPGGSTEYERIEHQYKPPQVAHTKHIYNRKKGKRSLGVRFSPPATRKSGRRKKNVVELDNSAGPDDLLEQNKWLLDQVKLLKEEQSKLAARTTVLEQKNLLYSGGIRRFSSTQARFPQRRAYLRDQAGWSKKRVHVRIPSTRCTPEPSCGGSQGVEEDSVISLKEGDKIPEQWMDDPFNDEGGMKTPEPRSPSLNQGAGRSEDTEVVDNVVNSQITSGDRDVQKHNGEGSQSEKTIGGEETTAETGGGKGVDYRTWKEESTVHQLDSLMC